jgi:glycosyltransferase involved in cell wall biosynthesis
MKISAIIATFNEERHIGQCLTDLLEQRGLDGDFEVIVIDGGSRDNTVNIVSSFPEFGTRIRLIENPRRFQVYAWNIGWQAARGEYIAFIGAHCAYDRDYLSGCLKAIERTGATAVGPVQVPLATTSLGRAIAWCMGSPFGVGNARFRFTDREEEVDSVFSMFLKRETLERLGGYDERVAFDEDGEFNYRLRAAGGRIVVCPSLGARYFVRDSFRGLARQMFVYGYWRRFTRVLHPQRVPLRVHAPPALIAGLVCSLALAATPFRLAALAIPAAYLAFVAAATVAALPRIGIRCAAWIPLVLPVMHLSYGAGFWRGLLVPVRRVLSGAAPRAAA